ncbi:aldehyde dehydrogenase family protein, partial [Escherichia coli]|nr:aldehyde dehydrogenase family protein [Escherichia coli]
QIFDFFAGEVLRLAGEVLPSARPNIGVEVTREAVGVVGIITPWNFPTANVLIRAVPILAAGNTLVLKPSELSPRSAILLARLASDAGLPPGVLNMVPGSGHAAGAALAAHPGIDMLAFTGSTR